MNNSVEKIIKIKVDIKQAEADLRKLKSDINGADDVNIKVDVDTSAAVSGIQELQTELDNLEDANIDIGANSAGIDATVESTNNLTAATGDYGDELNNVVGAQNNFTDASTLNTAANVLQLGTLTNLNKERVREEDSIKRANIATELYNSSKGETWQKLNKEARALEGEMSKLKEGSKALAKKEKEYNKLIKKIVKLEKEINKEARAYTKDTAATNRNTAATSLNSKATTKNAIAKSRFSVAQLRAMASTKSFTKSLFANGKTMLGNIPIIGRLVSKLGLLGSAVAALAIPFFQAVTGMVDVDRWIKKNVDNIKNLYNSYLGLIQIGIKYKNVWPFLLFNKKARAEGSDIINAYKTLADEQERFRLSEIDFIKEKSRLELKIAEERRIAQDSENKDFKERYSKLKDLYTDTQNLGNERLKRLGAELAIMEKQAKLNQTTDEDALEIQKKRNEINQVKADIANQLRAIDRINKQILSEFNSSIKTTVKGGKGGGGKAKEDPSYMAIGPYFEGLSIENIKRKEEQVYQLKTDYAKKTADMLEYHAERVKEMDKQVLLNKVYLASEYAAVGANLANAIEGYYDQEIAALEAKGITEGAEYEKALKRREQAAIAGVIMSTGSAIMSTWASYMDAPGGVAGAILAGVQTAALLVTAATQINNIKNARSGNVSSSSATGAAPQYNVIAENSYNPLDEYLKGESDKNKAPIKAYVVSKNITTQQELDRQIMNNASI